MVDEFHRRIKEDTDESFSDSTCSSCLGGRSRRGGINITEVCAVLYNRSQLSPVYSTHVTSTKTITQRDPVPRSCHHSSRQQQKLIRSFLYSSFAKGASLSKNFVLKKIGKLSNFFFKLNRPICSYQWMAKVLDHLKQNSAFRSSQLYLLIQHIRSSRVMTQSLYSGT